jgi:hypothetical protein
MYDFCDLDVRPAVKRMIRYHGCGVHHPLIVAIEYLHHDGERGRHALSLHVVKTLHRRRDGSYFHRIFGRSESGTQPQGQRSRREVAPVLCPLLRKRRVADGHQDEPENRETGEEREDDPAHQRRLEQSVHGSNMYPTPRMV